MGEFGMTGQVFTNVDAGDIGANGLERTTNIGTRIGLHVVGLQMARATVNEEQKNGSIRRSFGRRSPQPSQFCESQSPQAEEPNAQEITARSERSEGVGFGVKVQHGESLGGSDEAALVRNLR
jgi:hypothetical protein